ncbi:hypothetical protein [Motiliproteus sp. SC1-56]|uniref:hypothetical protein n=1 Tax=Motiliproteus sp. SC1-56 TaxID=2799565 RepID=UPI001A8E4F3F|nr:hypothetical protein [Motiliproteus sp. SC1-56]
MPHDQYIDHPREIPITLESLPPPDMAPGGPVPAGGLRLRWREKVAVGRFLRVRIPTVQPDAWADMLVAWHRLGRDDYELGLRFLDAEQAFKMRLMEQICHINCYQAAVRRREGRQLSTQQAAREWIASFAADFPTVIP